MSDWTLVTADCLHALRDMDADSVDAIVTDPPYGLAFMGKRWDYDVPGVEAFAEMLRVLKPGGRLLCFAGTRTMHRMWCNIEDAGFTIEDTIAWMYGSGFPKHKSKLKPAYEPICVARKPAPKATPLNIDECRIETDDNLNGGAYSKDRKPSDSDWVKNGGTIHNYAGKEYEQPAGRWPANLIHDGSDGPIGLLGDAARFFYCAKASRSERDAGLGDMPLRGVGAMEDDTYEWSREAERGRKPRDAQGRNHHPTVKPIELMRWLVRLVTPAGGVVLDPFAGSGTTGIAAVIEGRKFIGIEREAEYAEIAERRIAHWAAQHQPMLGAA